MFTGIISHTGIFKEYKAGKQEMAIVSPELTSHMAIGDSLSVNGVCLSLTRKENNILFFDLSKETLSRTSLGFLRRGDTLNLELSLSLSSPSVVTLLQDTLIRPAKSWPCKRGELEKG